MAGFKVVAVKSLDDGSLDLEDLKAKAEKHKDELAAFMVSQKQTSRTFLLMNFTRSHTRRRSVCLRLVSRT